MKITETISKRIENLLTAPGQELGRWALFARFQIQLWRFCMRRLRVNNAMAMSAALSFRTIFAMIPALVLALLVLKLVTGPSGSRDFLREGLVKAGMANIVVVSKADESQSDQISQAQPEQKPISAADEIIKLVESVEQKLTFQRLGPVGVVLLIWTALTLLTTMERSLNRIYGARQSRSLVKRVMLYWSVLTLVPIVLVAAGYVGDKATESFTDVSVLSGLFWLLGWLGPALVGIILLAALYKLMPNTKVSYRSAVGGALVAVPLWLLAKYGFSLYVSEMVVGKVSLYGTLGLLPIFLFWLNLSWTIFLFGAELSHTAANLSSMQAAELAGRISLRPVDMLAAVVALARTYQAGTGAVRFEQIGAKLNLPDESVQKLLDRLIENQLVCPVENENANMYVLARPAYKIPLLEILEFDLPAGAPSTPSPYEKEITQLVTQVKNQTKNALGKLTLADILTWKKPT